MAKLPGLTNHTDDVIRSRSGGQAPKGRVIVNAEGPRTPGLSPVAAPVDTYFRPGQAPADDNLAQMAESLAALNPSLMRYAQVKRETEDETLSARVAQRYAGKTYSEAQELYQSDPDAQTLLGKRAIAANLGRAAAQEQGRAAVEFYETEFDKDGGDLDAYLNGLTRKAIEANPENPFFAEEFNEVFSPVAASIRAEHLKYRAGQTKARTAQAVHGSFLGTVQAGILREDDPATIADGLRASYEVNRAGMGISFQDQDRAMVGVIQQLTLQMEREPGNADKLFNVIKALASNQRTAADGTTQGSLLENAELGTDVANILAAAETKMGEVRAVQTTGTLDAFEVQAENGKLDGEALDAFFSDPKNRGVMTPARRSSLMAQDRAAKERAAQALIRQGQRERVQEDLQTIRTDTLAAADSGELSWIEDVDYADENGERQTVTADRRRREVTTDILAREKRRVAADTRAPEVVANESFNRQAQLFSVGRLDHPQWGQTLKAGVTAMSTVQAAGGLTDVTRQGYDLYKRLNAKVPDYLRTQLSDADADVYETARVLEEWGVSEADEALVASHQFHADPMRAASITSDFRGRSITAAIEDVSELEGIDNPEAVSVEAQKLARALIGIGRVPAKDAAERAVEHVARGFVKVNGWAVKANDRNIPADFPELAMAFLEDWQARYGEENGTELEDLTLQALSNTSAGWQVMLKGTGTPAAYGTEHVFSLRNLADIRQKQRAEAEARAVETNQTRDEPNWDLLGVRGGQSSLFYPEQDYQELPNQ